jgi:molecular chaperone GrpE
MIMSDSEKNEATVADAGSGGTPASAAPNGIAERDAVAAEPAPQDGLPDAVDDGARVVDGDVGPEAPAAPAAVAQAPVEVDPLALLAAQRDEYLALAQRTQADFENYRKRMARETRAAEGRGVAKVVKELLPALDNLDRALRSAAQDDPLLHGIRLVQSDIGGALTRLGIEAFSPTGERFDPSVHEAMAQAAVEGAEAGTVIEVYSPGYRAGEIVLRPARVVVAA